MKRAECVHLIVVSALGLAQLVVSVVLALIAIGALWVYHGQLKVMRGQLGEVIRQYPEIQKSANAAKSAAETADATLQSSQKQFRMEQRPYIWALPVTGPNNGVLPAVGQKLFIRVDFRNAGRTPAINVIATPSKTIVGPKDQARKEVREYVAQYEKQAGQFLAPETSGTAGTGFGPTLTSTMLANISDGTWEMFTVGAVKYTDVFGPPAVTYETTYCYAFNPTGLPFSGCNFRENTIK